MAFHWQRVLAVYRKDTLDLTKNRGLLFSMLALPAVLVIVPTVVVWAYARDPSDVNLRVMAQYYDPTLPHNASAAAFLIEKTLSDWFGLFLVMPVFVPILISSQSVAGEKERRTLEPLLASPVTAAELVIGKSLASLVPAVLITWAAFLCLCATVDGVGYAFARQLLLPNALWLFGVGIIAPLFAFFGNGVAVLVSARVGEARLAQQISALVVLPLVGLVGSAVAGLLKSGTGFYAIQGAVVLVLDLILIWVSVRMFDRERLISRWA